MTADGKRLIVERPVPRDLIAEAGACPPATSRKGRPARSVAVNLAESPLGWLKAHGHVSARQYDAGDRLRRDWEIARIAPRVTMKWDAPPIDRTARGAPAPGDATRAGIAAKARFDAAVEAVGPGLSDVLWRVVCAGEGMREAESALGWPARAGKLVLGLALDRLAGYYRIA